jgi:peptidyl-prolyl cis-trans isomerase SurA
MANNWNRKYLPMSRLRVWMLAGMLVLGLWTVGVVRAEEIVDRIVAVVNDEIITYLELQRQLKPYEEKTKSMGYAEDEERQMLYKVRNDIIQNLIDEKLADQEIKKNKITVSEAEIDASIERLKASRAWSDEDLRNALKTEGMTIQELRQSMKDQALRNRLVGQEVRSKIVITNEEVLAYYDSHADEYGGELHYHLRIIIIMISLENEDGRAAAKTKIEMVLQKLKDGESFETLAQEYSESSLAKKGGDLGKIRYDDISPQIKDALEGLVPGDHTAILDTEQGYQIFYVEEVVVEGGKSYEAASPEIEEQLYNAAVDKKYAEWLEDLKRQAHIKIIR